MKQSPDELEVSVVAARDIDGPRECNWCRQVKPVTALMAAGFNCCADCYRAIERDGNHDA